MTQEDRTSVQLSRKEVHVAVEINPQTLESMRESKSRQPSDIGTVSSISERTREGYQGTISIAKVSPIMNTSIAKKEKLAYHQKHPEDGRSETSTASLLSFQLGQHNGKFQEHDNQKSNILYISSDLQELNTIKSDVIANAQKMDETQNKRSTNKDAFHEVHGSDWDSDDILHEEFTDRMEDIKPMQPITRASFSGYVQNLESLSSTRYFANKAESPSLRFLSNMSGYGRRRLGVSSRVLTSDYFSRIFDRKRTFSSMKSVLNVNYCSNVNSADVVAGYINEGDALKSGLVCKVDDFASGYMSENSAFLYSRKDSNKKQGGVFSGHIPHEISSDLQDNSLEDSWSLSSGISDTTAEPCTDDNMTISLYSETNVYGSSKHSKRENLPSKNTLQCSDPSSKVGGDKIRKEDNLRGSSTSRMIDTKRTNSSMQTESSVFQQMSSAAWKKYLKQYESSSQSVENHASDERVRNIDTNRIRGKNTYSYGSTSRKNGVCKYNDTDGHRSNQEVLTAVFEKRRDRNLKDDDFPGEKCCSSGRNVSSKPFTEFSESLSICARDVRRVQGPHSMSGSTLNHGVLKRPISTSSVSSNSSEKSCGSTEQRCNNSSFEKLTEITKDNEVGQFDELDGSHTCAVARSPTILGNEKLSRQPDQTRSDDKRKTNTETLVNTHNNVNDVYLFDSFTHFGKCNSLGRRTTSKAKALTSPTLSLRDHILQPFTKERSLGFFSPLKYSDGDTGNYVSLDQSAVLYSQQSGSPSLCSRIRYSGGSVADSVSIVPVTRTCTRGGLTEAESSESLSSASSDFLYQRASRHLFPLSPVNPILPVPSSRCVTNASGHVGGQLSKSSNRDVSMHCSTLSLTSTTSSLYLTAHMVAAFEHSLSNMTDRFQHLTASAEQKDSQLGELRNTIEALKKQSTEAGLTKIALQSMQATQRTTKGKMSRQFSTDSVSSVNSQSSTCSNPSVRYDNASCKGKKKRGWLRDSFSKAFSRSKKNKNGSISDVEDLKQFQYDSSTPNSPLLESHPLNKSLVNSFHSASNLCEKEDDHMPELVKDLKKQLREKDMALTDIRLEALTSAHQLENLKDTVNKLKAEIMNLKQHNERLQRIVSSKSLISSNSSVLARNSMKHLEKNLSSSEHSGPPNIATDENGKRIIISAYLCCHGNYKKVTAQNEPTEEMLIGSVSVNAKTKWDLLDNVVKKAFKEYLFRIDPVTSLGLSAESVLSYHTGNVVRAKEADIPDLLPCGYLIGDNMQIRITLKGTKQNSIDALAFETLIPKSVIQRYVSLLLEHRRIILCGPSGTGKTYLAQKLAEFLVFRNGKDLGPGAVATFSVDHKSAKELQQYLLNLAEQCESSNGFDLPTVIILDNLHHVGSLDEVFNGFLSAKYQNCPYIIGTMNQTTCSTTNLQLHHNFRWILCANHMEPVKRFLGRYLRRKLVEEEVYTGVKNPILNKIIDWVPEVWAYLNKFLETHSSSDVTIGPRLFLSCPVDVSSSQVWFTDLWNYSIIPYLLEAVREGLQLYGRRAHWEDPTEWVQESYPWPSLGDPDWPQLLRLRPEDVGYEGHPSSSLGTKSVQSEVEADPLFNMLMRLQEAARYSSPHNNDNESTSIHNTEDFLNTELESTL
ncbi:uncharacterized protein LOC143237656 isoform X2 [Tachypleus tridentatus]|uniref:uncharacterized protein LOC143237656 isoform X2 n=1 Tax=Tachypleus tridentatus TaxID=6853 RepID=UPI003FD52953